MAQSPSIPQQRRLRWILGGSTFLLCVLLATPLISGALERRSARHSAGSDTVRLKRREPLPAWKPGPGWATAEPPQPLPGEAIHLPIYPPWTREQADNIFIIGDEECYDPICGKLWIPSNRFPVVFSEYPNGKLEFVVNSRSMREDNEPLATKPALRVLVAGDSHTDGVCMNSESFPNLAERALQQRAQADSEARGMSFATESIEVLNAGKGGHSFFNYLGVLEKNLDLAPDVFVLTAYGGNDFDELLASWHFYFTGGVTPGGTGKYWNQIRAALRIKHAALSQALSSVKYFATYPEEKALAVHAAAEVCGQIQALCRERGIHFIVMYLPPRQDVEPDNPELKLDALLKALELPRESLASTDEIADQMLVKLDSMGIETIDLRPKFRESKSQLYWSLDWHINLAGHQLAARALVKALSVRH